MKTLIASILVLATANLAVAGALRKNPGVEVNAAVLMMVAQTTCAFHGLDEATTEAVNIAQRFVAPKTWRHISSETCRYSSTPIATTTANCVALPPTSPRI